MHLLLYKPHPLTANNIRVFNNFRFALARFLGPRASWKCRTSIRWEIPDLIFRCIIPVVLQAIREGVGYVKTQLYCTLFIMLTTCFGHCGPSSGHKNAYRGKLYYSYTLLIRGTYSSICIIQTKRSRWWTYTMIILCGPYSGHKNVYRRKPHRLWS